MNQIATFIVYAAVAVTSAVAQLDLPSIPPGGTVQIFTQNLDSNLCVGAVADSAQSEILLEPCTRNLTMFVLPSGADNTQIVLGGVPTGQPELCITASQSQAGNTPVILQACGGDPFQIWQFPAGEGRGEVVSTASGSEECLTAVGSNQGDPIEYRPCTNATNQQWFTVVSF
ncbi:unnamed protein product [Peniophora sp. CBMAI 1063]|nr:unnamed protein product [Peniophora sp. CBMAI 1063]